ncbi:Gfo/Idh/MocA family protein [Streptomyces sp. NPDC058289]|uniref:Gfo/Idh/MocA family protein n=1 Tax=Streptomyces sp. NPDC058289 TaxID=3346425 RepID=UPI0036E4118A
MNGQRSGIIGAGFIGEVHARAVRSAGGVLVAVADATPEGAIKARDRLGAQRAARSAEELISADDIDVVHICTPNHLHAELALKVLAAGKHVICEKPLATDVASAQQLVQAAADAGTVAAVPFIYRFYSAVREARGRIARGDTGPLRLLHGSYLQDWLSNVQDNNWRVDPKLGGSSRAFGDIGVHWCDLVEFATGHRIARLSARMLTAHPERAAANETTAVSTEDVATVLFDTDQGALGSVVVSQVSHGRKNRLWLSIDGTQSSVSFDQELPDSLWVGQQLHNLTVMRGSADTTSEAQRFNVLPPGHPQGYQDCFNAFVADVYAAVDGDVPDGLPTFADGYRAAVLTAAVLESARTDSWVTVL